MSDVADKLSYFQAITGLEDIDLCTDILSAHNWNLELAISTITSNSDQNIPSTSSVYDVNAVTANDSFSSGMFNSDENIPLTSSSAVNAVTTNDSFISGINNSDENIPSSNSSAVNAVSGMSNSSGLVWKIVSIPVTVISGSLGLVSRAISLGFWIAGGVFSYSLGMIGMRSTGRGGMLLVEETAAVEAMRFVEVFESEFGDRHVDFVGEGFMDALQRSRREFKLLFVYLHSPDHPDTSGFCGETLCDEVLADFVDENFVAWGGSIRASEGFKMSNSLKASRFPFCAVVMAATNQRIALLQQVEGPKSPEEMLTVLQRVLEESSPVLVAARLEADERITNIRLREEQDAAYRAALEADQARERQRKEEEERLAKEAAEAERKQKEEAEALERAAREAAEKEAALAKLREEKALSLGPEPEKGPDVTQVLVRLPDGERKGRRFYCTATVQSLYDFIDSSSCLEIGSYTLATNFPRVLYGPDKLSSTLKDAGLHPQVSLFVELNS